MQLASGGWGVVVPQTQPAALPAQRSVTLRVPLSMPKTLRLSLMLVEGDLQTVICDLGNCLVALPDAAADDLTASQVARGEAEMDPRSLRVSVTLDVIDATAAEAPADGAGSGWAAKVWLGVAHAASSRQWTGCVAGFIPVA
jgi:hypothetical protein